MKGKSGIKDAVFQWAYQNRRQKTKTSEVLRSIEEVEKTLFPFIADSPKNFFYYIVYCPAINL